MGRSLDHSGFIFPQGYLFGLTLSTAGASATFSVAAGEAVDTAFAGLMTLGSSISKTTSAWAVGSASGGLDTGAIANSTWYHAYLIKRPDTGVVDVLFSLSASAPTMPTNYTLKRRIGSLLTNGSAQWTKFIQVGDEFTWDIGVNNVNSNNPGTAAVTITFTVPTGLQVTAKYAAVLFISAANNITAYFSPLDIADTAPSSVGVFSLVADGAVGTDASAASGSEFYTRTNTSSQIRYRLGTSNASTTIRISTLGWVDTRGKLQ